MRRIRPGLRRPSREHSVFLNVPFDKSYERCFVALIAAIVCIRRTPRCVLELPELGAGRLARLIAQLRDCRVSIHDLSRCGVPVRFNMPFELGLACAISHVGQQRHDYAIFERVAYRTDRTLSDLKGRDPEIHGGSMAGTVRAVLNVFGTQKQVSFEQAYGVAKALWTLAQQHKRVERVKTVFSRRSFEVLVSLAVELAVAADLLPR